MEREGWRFPPERREVLLREERMRDEPPGPILAQAGVRPGDTVIDLGAGNGFWTVALSEAVGSKGTVYAADVEPVMLDDLRRLIEERGLTNVEVVKSEELRVPLPNAVADFVLLSFVLHEPGNTPAFVDEVVRLLKPSGRVLVMEWQKWPTEAGPPVEHRVSREEAHALLGDAGLSVTELRSPTPDAYILLADAYRQGDLEHSTPTI